MKRVTASCILVLFAGTALAGGYRTTIGEGDDTIALVVVHGTPYEMGYAFGSLMKTEAEACMIGFVKKAEDTHMGRLQAPYLDKAWAAIEPYTDPRYIEELKGVADGAGQPFDEVRRAHTIPVVSDYACSGVAVWGDKSVNGDLYQLRNLDYTMDAGMQDNPAIVVYIPNDGLAHVNVTFAGCISCNTGINVEGIVLGEKGETPWTDFPYKLDGPHFMTLFRTMLYDAHSLDEALGIVRNTPRIKRYYWYIGDGKIPEAVKIKTFMPVMPEPKIWRGGDPDDELAPKVLPNVVYQTMKNDLAYDTLSKTEKFDAEKMIELSRSVRGGGNLLDVVYNATQLELWAAYAEKSQAAGERTYVHLKIKNYLDPAKVPAGATVFEKKP